MKKMMLILGLFLICSPVFAADVDGRTDKNVFIRTGTVIGRGVLNAVGMPAEVVSTAVREAETHKWLWPVTVLPRLFNNVVVRTASAFNDIFFMPFSTAFSDDISPMTEPMGLPEYPWQVHEG